MSSGPVVIVGAGLAGLRCAQVLADAGVRSVIYEASDGVGGRARSDSVQGFQLDRGFQVLLTDYPEAKRTFDYGMLDLGNFEPGAMVRMGEHFRAFADPIRRPRSALSSLVSPVGTAADKLRVARMRQEILSASPEEILSRPDVSAIRSLEARGFSSGMIERFFRPFFGGVFIDGDLGTSSRLLEIFFRCFSSGSAALPAGGMGSLAAQLADGLGPDVVKLNQPVTGVKVDGVRLADDSWVEAGSVVIATEERAAAGLLGTEAPAKSPVTSCVYFDAPDSGISGSWLVLSQPGEGPINEVAVPSSVASGYAPAGRSLVSVSAIGPQAQRPDLLEAVTEQLSGWFGHSTIARWRHLSTTTVEDALPVFEPGRFVVGGQPPKLDSGMFICGDYRESPSIQGALVSGRKAAEAVLEKGAG